MVGFECSPEVLDDVEEDFGALDSVDVVDLALAHLVGEELDSLSVCRFPRCHPVDVIVGAVDFLELVFDVLVAALALGELALPGTVELGDGGLFSILDALPLGEKRVELVLRGLPQLADQIQDGLDVVCLLLSEDY